jgi:alpha-ribazole phosphatase
LKLYLARHGESEGNVKRLLYGHTDCPLTESGRADGRALHDKLAPIELARCYASPLCRAADTARLALAGRDVPITLLRGLMEQHMGELENTSFEEMRRLHPETINAMLEDWSKITPPGGESYRQVQERAMACVREIVARDEDALIVSHNGALSTVMAALLDTGGGSVDKFWFNHGCYSCLELTHGRVKLVGFNL